MAASNHSHGEQLLPTLLENRANVEPNGIFAKIPLSTTTYAQGFRSVTNAELCNAINRVAWLIDGQFGKGHNFPTLAYLGPSDLRYSIVVVAAIKAGYKASHPIKGSL